jgi:hypothetical protein
MRLNKKSSGSDGASTASQIAVEGTYPFIPGTPTDLESTISSINDVLGGSLYVVDNNLDFLFDNDAELILW